mmetsp:Transcript_11585/g.29257  ORF Transcript_11585/g.29257 Transcript_11585/m.29257 type:complete len:102 (-) Transcript_11585:112-417(-)
MDEKFWGGKKESLDFQSKKKKKARTRRENKKNQTKAPEKMFKLNTRRIVEFFLSELLVLCQCDLNGEGEGGKKKKKKKERGNNRKACTPTLSRSRTDPLRF